MRNATLFLFGAVLAFAAPVAAQCTGTAGVDFSEVTIREINDIPDGNIDQLVAGGASLTIAEIQPLVQPTLLGARVQFTAVLLTDPFKSGVRSLNSEGIPGGIHTFMRDVSAATLGTAGMGTQVVDFSGTGTLQAFFAGDELVVCGEVEVFEGNGGSSMQVAVESATFTGTSYDAADPLRQPVVVTTDDIHNSFMVEGAAKTQFDWTVYEDFNGQYVRFEEIELLQGVGGDRVDILYSSPGQDTQINQYDISVCFRNDRGPEYFPTAGSAPDCIDDDFVPPVTGIVNVQGFLIFQGDDGTFDFGVPDEAHFNLNPFEEADFEIAVAPPIVTPDFQLAQSSGAPVRATVIPGTAGNTVASVVADYTTSSGGSGQIALANSSGDVYEGTITGLSENDFVTYTITATDNESASITTDAITRLVVGAAVTSIFQVQSTPDGGQGASAITTADPIPFDLDAVVQTSFEAGSRFQATIQDDPSLGPFSGVLLDFGSTDPGLAVGDQITISSARVSEFRDATQLVDVTFSTTAAGDPYPAKVVTTDLFNGTGGAATGEQHEGMFLRFVDAAVSSTNPDDPSNFGEWAFSSDGTAANQLRGDDAANEIPNDFNASLTVGQDITIAGFLTYSFGFYKLIPVRLDDITLGATAAEGGLETGNVRIVSAFPNPAADALRVRFELATAGAVSLRVFDTTGREVAVVAEGAFSAAQHTVEADLTGLAAGVYVLRLVADGEVATSRIAVVR